MRKYRVIVNWKEGDADVLNFGSLESATKFRNHKRKDPKVFSVYLQIINPDERKINP